MYGYVHMAARIFLEEIFLRGAVMKILIAGLGLIGGSMAKALVRAGYKADGFDRDAVTAAARRAGAVASMAGDFKNYDLVLIALPPDETMRLLDTAEFKDGAIVADICGVKTAVGQIVRSKKRNYRYVGCHPMAGKEVSGFANSDETLFDGASMIIVEDEQTDRAAADLLQELFYKMGFSFIRRCSAGYHDRKIAYTSQLAHIVSNAYVKSETADDYRGFTGGSFQDMTRIAGVDERIWTRLYFLNRDNIAGELRGLIFELNKYLCALEEGKEDDLRDLLKEGRLRKEKLDGQAD